MLQLQDGLSEPMKKLYTEHATGKKQMQLTLDEIFGALNSELAKFQATFGILDGLDETPMQRNRAELLSRIEALQPQPKLMVTSRPLPEIRAWFNTNADHAGFHIDE